jgi:hypothetical protein
MKVEELFEMPELRDWEIDPVKAKWTDDKPTYQSFSAFERIYNEYAINEYAVHGDILKFGLSKKLVTSTAFIEDIKPLTGENALRIVSNIMFYYPRPVSKLPREFEKALQVQKVYTEAAFEHRGIASFMYAALAKLGYVIVSDKVQYLGGKMLWVKMAKEAGLRDYSIKLWNEDNGWKKDEIGDIIEYNGSNIKDADIWSKGSSLGQKTVFILQAR